MEQLCDRATPSHDAVTRAEGCLPGVAGWPVLAGFLTVTCAADLAGRVIHVQDELLAAKIAQTPTTAAAATASGTATFKSQTLQNRRFPQEG